MEKDIVTKILQGKIFIYPTDTIYGIGCNALDREAVEKIRDIKQRDNKPFSVIAPNISWIKEHCRFNEILEKYLPGPYTLILEKFNPEFLSHVSNLSTLGVRIPNNDFCKQIQKSQVPFITTSVNLSGQPFATKISEIPDEIKSQVDVIIDAGKLTGKPSTLIIDGKEVSRK